MEEAGSTAGRDPGRAFACALVIGSAAEPITEALWERLGGEGPGGEWADLFFEGLIPPVGSPGVRDIGQVRLSVWGCTHEPEDVRVESRAPTARITFTTRGGAPCPLVRSLARAISLPMDLCCVREDGLRVERLRMGGVTELARWVSAPASDEDVPTWSSRMALLLALMHEDDLAGLLP